MPAPVAIFGIAFLASLLSKIAVWAMDFLVKKSVKRALLIAVLLTTIMALFSSFWTVLNGLASAAYRASPSELYGLIPMFLPDNVDEVISAALSVRVLASILIFNSRFINRVAPM